MKISLNWLRTYVDIPDDVHSLASILTDAGLEVESFEEQGKELQNFVVGKVLTCQKHPKADKLSICTVDSGDEIHTVVCGAPNVAAEQHIIFAKPGAVVPNGGFIIEKKIIHGIESTGMICSPAELNLSEDHSGIIVLPDTSQIGQPAAEYFERTDIIFEIGITPNRVDALSHVGVARDAAALTKKTFSLPVIHELPTQTVRRVFVEIEDPDLCPRYSSAIIRGIRITESPAWLKQRLEAVGVRSINNVVDVTNFVMYEIGHPMHAFDLATLSDERIVVRRSTEGEKFQTLDGKERTLAVNTLLICDTLSAVAIAGVMGGANSEISFQTKDVLLESAYFNPSSIRKTSRALGVSTDSSYRFERGADPNITPWALRRAAQLILEIAGGTFEASCDIYPSPIRNKIVSLRLSRVDRILGIHVDPTEVDGILMQLGIEVTSREDVLVCSIPTYRPDLEREIDLIEEVARIYGYDKIPTPTSFKVSTGDHYDDEAFIREVRRICIGMGLFEAQSSSLIDTKKAELFASGNVITVLNPVSSDRPALRPSMIPSLLENLDLNIRNGSENIRMFEIGSIYKRNQIRGDANSDPLSHYTEEFVAGIALTGEAVEKTWTTNPRRYNFYDAKGLCQAILEHLHLDNYSFVCYDNSDALSKYKLSIELQDTYVGHVSELSEEICTEYNLKQHVFVVELHLQNIETHYALHQRYTPVAKYPVVSRDFAFVFDITVQAKAVIDYVDRLHLDFFQGIRVIDVFEDESLGKNKKSLAFSVQFQSHDRTLTDSEIKKSAEQITEGVTSYFHAVLRSN